MSADEVTPDQEGAADEQGAARRPPKWDPELLVLADMIRTLDRLDARARARAVSYLTNRYQEQAGADR